MAIANSGGVFPQGNFIKKVYADLALAEFLADFVVPQITNTDYEGEISGQGDTVIIRKPISIDVFSVGIGQDWPMQTNVQDDVTTMTIDYRDIFNVEFEDAQGKQVGGKFEAERARKAAYALGKNLETRVLNSLPAAAGGNFTISSLDSTNAHKGFVNADVVLTNANTPREGRWAVIDPTYAGFLGLGNLSQAYLTGDKQSPLRTGIAVPFPISGFAVYISTLLPANKALFGVKEAVSLAVQMNDTEILRSTKRKADIFRGEVLYGYKTLLPSGLVVGNITAYGNLLA